MQWIKFITYLGLLLTFQVNAQSFIKYSFGASLSGTYNGSIESGSSSQLVKGAQTYAGYIDSVSTFKSPKTAIGINFWGQMMVGKRMNLQVGLGYQDVGFEILQDNIKYLDPFYPGIGQGKLMDLSGGSGTKSITYNYHFRYIQLPVLFHYEIYHSRDFYYRVSLTGGVAVSYLLSHTITASLKNFVQDGDKDQYTLDSTGYNARSIALSTMVGAKGEYRLDKNTIIYAMPMIGIYPISVTSGPITTYPWYLQLNVGFQYALRKQEDQKKKK